MCSQIHILLEVPAVPEDGVSDGVFLNRLSGIYGEAVGGGGKGNGKKARIGLILAIQNPGAGVQNDVAGWKDASRRYRRLPGIALERKISNFRAQISRGSCAADGMDEAEAFAAMKRGEGVATESHRYLPELSMAEMLRHRGRHLGTGLIFLAAYLHFVPVHGWGGDREQGIRERVFCRG